MPVLIVDDDGAVWRLPAGSTVPVQLTLPAGVSAIVNKYPAGVRYRTRFYLTGPWNRPLVFTEDYKLRRLGVSPPPAAVTVAEGAAGNVNTASTFTYITFAEKLPNGRVIAESNPSTASNTLTNVTNKIVTVTGLPTTAADSRVTHVRGWRSDGGAIAKLAWEVPLGVSSVSDNLSTAGLAAREALPNEDGSLTLENGVPPYAKFLEVYHERMWYAGSPAYPDRIYYSKLQTPEGVGASSFVRTLDGEAVTGLKRVGDQLIVFTRRASYDIQGWTGADFRIRKIHPAIGCISHHSIVNINERLWFAAEPGVYIYDGGFRYVMDDIRPDWRTRFIANPNTFELAHAVDDREMHVYRLLIPYAAGAFYYVGNYEKFDPSVSTAIEDSRPWWNIDVRGRYDRSQGLLTVSNTGRQKAYTGSDDGIVREENVFTNANDDADSQGKIVEVRTRHFFFEDPGGEFMEGKELLSCWSYIKAEDSAWTFVPIGGDEEANSTAAELWSDSVAASATGGKVAKTRHFHKPERIVGAGFTFKFKATGPLNWTFRGVGGNYSVGPQFRGST